MKHDEIFLPDTIKINNINKNIKTKVTQDVIIIHDTSLTLNKGDMLSRKLPNNTIDQYEVMDVHFKTGLKNKGKKKVIPDEYIVKYKKL